MDWAAWSTLATSCEIYAKDFDEAAEEAIAD
jgi:hypothetical protein